MAFTRMLMLAVSISGCAGGRIPPDTEATPAVDAPPEVRVGGM